MTRDLALVCFLVAAPAIAAAQPPPPPPPPPPGAGSVTMVSGQTITMQEGAAPEFGTGAISGIVTDGATGAPIAGALVAITGGTPGSAARPRQMTDSRGRYIFTHLPVGGFFVSAVRPGYLDGGYRRVPGVTGGVRINVADGQWFTEGHVQLWKPASIGGIVSDERNEPLVGIPVRILTRTHVGGFARWIAGTTVTTDDRGQYRIPGLMAGDYIVHVPSVQVTMPTGEIALYTPPQRSTSTGAAAQARSQPIPDIVRRADGTGIVVGHYATPDDTATGRAYPMTFFPSARTLDVAEVVQLTFGEDRRSVDVQMRPVPTVSVSGRVIGPVEAIANLPVRLMPQGSEAMGAGAEAGMTKTDAQGEFTFHLVPDGEYTILASRTVSEYSTGTTTTMAPTVVPASANPFVSRTSMMQVTGCAMHR